MIDSSPLFRSDEPVVSRRAILFNGNEGAAEKDRIIWDAFRMGSREAFDHIFRQHASNLFAYGSKFTKDEELVLDCVQDLFVGLWNSRNRLGETSSINYYLLKTLRHRLARTMQRARRQEAVADDANYLEEKFNVSMEDIFVVQETELGRRTSLTRAIDGLTKRQRESIYLKFYQGLDNVSVASVMGLSSSSVTTLVSQSIKALREALA